MSNLIEKSLLIGFSVFILICFFLVAKPYISEIFSTDNKKNNELDEFEEYIENIDSILSYVIENNIYNYEKKISYPLHTITDIKEDFIEIKYKSENYIDIKYLEYNDTEFSEKLFADLTKNYYLLNISRHGDIYFIDFSEI